MVEVGDQTRANGWILTPTLVLNPDDIDQPQTSGAPELGTGILAGFGSVDVISAAWTLRTIR